MNKIINKFTFQVNTTFLYVFVSINSFEKKMTQLLIETKESFRYNYTFKIDGFVIIQLNEMLITHYLRIFPQKNAKIIIKKERIKSGYIFQNKRITKIYSLVEFYSSVKVGRS